MNSTAALPISLHFTVKFLEQLERNPNYTWASLACLFAFVVYASTRPKSPYNAIPAIGRTGFFSSYVDAFRFFKHAHEIIQEGYDKYHPGTFRISSLNRWQILVSGEKLTEELRKAPDDTLSFIKAANDGLAAKWTFGPNVAADHYHVPVVRTQLTRHLGSVFADMREEITLAFEDYVPVTEDWTSVRALDAVMKIISRVSNRVFIGAPTTCRDPEYIALTIRFALDVVMGAQIIGLFPPFLKPFAGRFLTRVPKSTKLGAKHLKPIIAKRQQMIAEYGSDYPGQPLDMLSWLMAEAQGQERTAENLTRRILVLNFASIHTSSSTFTHALFELAIRPEYIEPLREEIEAVVAEHGWSKVAMSHMRKLDSFIKETQRFRGLFAVSMGRHALKEFTFSDGTRIPKGGMVHVAAISRHMDNEVYPDAGTFKGFRFSEIRQEAGEGIKNQMSATSPDFLPFGHGRHACPGRFFAALEMKTMMAHVLLTYDLKIVGSPEESWFATTRFPDEKAEVLFRKRRN